MTRKSCCKLCNLLIVTGVVLLIKLFSGSLNTVKTLIDDTMTTRLVPSYQLNYYYKH